MQLYSREDTCQVQNEYDGAHLAARISSVFVILITSLAGTYFPIISSRYTCLKMPDWCFFFGKFFGSGVIVATAFVHLLQPASESLSDPCLGGVLGEYPWAYGICLMSLFALFFGEACAYTFLDRKLFCPETMTFVEADDDSLNKPTYGALIEGCSRVNKDDPEVGPELPESNVSGQLLSLFILEFGIVFHSVFIGLALAVSGNEFKELYIVLIFHQMFEGLGLGSRIATAPWPKDRSWTPLLLGAGYAITTPIGIAIGLGVRDTYSPGSRTALLTNGIFDAISSGILIYSGLVELMAHEFLFSDQFRGKGGGRQMITAYLIMCLGAGLMALIGKWA